MTNPNFFEHKFDNLLIEIPKTISGIAHDNGSTYNSLKPGFSRLPPVTERHIMKALGKPLPLEFLSFYSKVGMLNYQFNGSYIGQIVQAEVMMNFKYAPLHAINEEYIQKNKYQKSPFWKVFFYDLHIDNLDLANPDSIKKLDQLRRLKLIATHSTNLYHVAVDFFDNEKEYQLYNFHRGDIAPIDLSFSQFVEGFMYLGDTLMWWTNFIKPEYKLNQNYPSWEDIEREIKGFKREMLFNKS